MTKIISLLIGAVICLSALVACEKTPETLTKKFVVRRVTTSGTCQVRDSQAAPVGVIVGGGPFDSSARATERMCELRTTDPADATKCFQVNPENACGDSVSGEVDLPESTVRYLDDLPLVEVNVEDAVLPNGRRLGQYKKELEARGTREPHHDLIFPTDTPQEQLSQLFTKFFDVASNLVNRSKHQFEVGEPKQNGIGYNFGSRDYETRQKMFAPTCNLKVHGLDCSGMLHLIFSKSGCKGMNVTAAQQSKPATLNAAINGVITGVAAKDKGKLTAADIITGDIIYWDKVESEAASHIGVVLKSGNVLFVFQSNGSQSLCSENLTVKRGPRTLALNDSYWFAADCNWKVLRYEIT